jgi:hypothetical protein
MVKYVVLLLFAMQVQSAEFRLPLLKLTISAEDVAEIESLGKIVRPTMIVRTVRSLHRDLHDIDLSKVKTRYGVLQELLHYYIHRAEYRSGTSREKIMDDFELSQKKAAPIISSISPPNSAGVTILYEFLNLYYQSFSATLEADSTDIFRFLAHKQKILGLTTNDMREGMPILREDLPYLEGLVFVLQQNRQKFLNLPAFTNDSRMVNLSRSIQQLENDFKIYKAEINSIIVRLKEPPIE